MFVRLSVVVSCLLFLFPGCADNKSPEKKADLDNQPHLFTLLSPDSTHVLFINSLAEGLNTNVLLYEYFYNGAGVATSDLNNDGLQDIYFSGNMTDNKLFLNKGNMKFEDITTAAGVAGRPGPWKTGVTVADINGDGMPDIFVSYSGKLSGPKRISQLFVNKGNNPQGVPLFEEQAEKFGLADSSYATQSFFFDSDCLSNAAVLASSSTGKLLGL